MNLNYHVSHLYSRRLAGQGHAPIYPDHLVLVKRVPTAKAYGLVKVIYRPVKYIFLLSAVFEQKQPVANLVSILVLNVFERVVKNIRCPLFRKASARTPEKYHFTSVSKEPKKRLGPKFHLFLFVDESEMSILS